MNTALHLFPSTVFVIVFIMTAQAPVPVETRVDTFLTRQMQLRKIPGLSVGVVKDGTLVLAKGYGDANLEWKASATPETVYLLASVTKPLTATAIMMLAQEGRLKLDDPISAYVAGTPASWSGITIRHLLTHTAGLKDRFELTADSRMFMDYSAAEMLDAARQTPVDFTPGTKFQYSDQGYFLLGLVVEKASGVSYAQFMRDRIFGPAGMTSASLHDWRAIVPNRADNYALADNAIVGSRRRYRFGVVSHYGIQSTIRDLARFDAALSAGTLLPPGGQQQMWTPARLGDGTPVGLAGIGYGFGWFLEKFNGHREVYHGGTTGTCVYRLPDDGVSAIVLTNLDQASGSDPCFLARGVAAQYVPGIAIVSVPATADPDAARSKRLRAAIESFVRGTLDPADYTPEAYQAINGLVASQAAAFRQLGAIQSFELIADDTLVSDVVQYRVRFQQATVHLRFVLDRAGKIAAMTAR
jgi:CubicO group peptidase (beta-lactamase class C family)